MTSVVRGASKGRSPVGLVALLVLMTLAACGGSGPATKGAVKPATPADVAPAPKPVATTSAPSERSLRRSAVRSVVKGGLGLFLQRAALDDQPVMKEGHFYGFRIAALHDPEFWSGVDLRPGDVITRVNGMPIEHPEEALEAFHSLEVASELRVAYDRDGAARELAYTILDDEPQKHADASAP
jgi:S1-C subfamily serine protease